MSDFDMILAALIELGHKAGQLTDTEVLQALDCLEDADLTKAQAALAAAGIKIVPGEPEFIDDVISGTGDPEEDWGGGALDSFSMYMREIGQYPLLSEEEERELCIQLRDGRAAAKRLKNEAATLSEVEKVELKALSKAADKAKDKLVEHNLRLVVSFAKQYENSFHDLQLLDLIQSGNMGLMKGIEYYDVDRGFRLSTYVTWWIRQAITRDIANLGHAIRVPVHMSERLRKIMAVEKRLEQEQNCSVTDEQLAEELGISVEELSRTRLSRQTVVSTDTPISEETDGMVLGDLLTEDGPGPEEQFEKTDLRNAVHEVMGKVLSPKEQLVLNHRLGMNGESAKTLAEVGDLMGITRERVRQIESKALRKMKCTSLRKRYMDYVQDGHEEQTFRF